MEETNNRVEDKQFGEDERGKGREMKGKLRYMIRFPKKKEDSEGRVGCVEENGKRNGRSVIKGEGTRGLKEGKRMEGKIKVHDEIAYKQKGGRGARCGEKEEKQRLII